MIIITGTHQQQILKAMSYNRTVRSGMKVEEKEIPYTSQFLCRPADNTDDGTILHTHFEINDAKCLRKKADIEGLQIKIEVL